MDIIYETEGRDIFRNSELTQVKGRNIMCSTVRGLYFPLFGKNSYTPVTPNGDFTATFGDFKFSLVAGDRCMVAFNRRLAVTPKHRSQQIAAFLHN